MKTNSPSVKPNPKTTKIINELVGAWAELSGYVIGINFRQPRRWDDNDMTWFNNHSVDLRDKIIEKVRRILK